MKSEVYIEKLRRLRWLKDIAKQYKEHLELMEREKYNYKIQAISYTARCDGRVFQLNPHRPIPAEPFHDALAVALDNIREEIEELEAELKTTVVEL